MKKKSERELLRSQSRMSVMRQADRHVHGEAGEDHDEVGGEDRPQVRPPSTP
jgi:hypothetical protein